MTSLNVITSLKTLCPKTATGLGQEVGLYHRGCSQLRTRVQSTSLACREARERPVWCSLQGEAGEEVGVGFGSV